MLRSPITMSASPERSGATSRAMSRPGVLIVGVRVDDDVGAGFEAGVDARDERRGQTLLSPEPHDVVDAKPPGDLGRAVVRSVVNDQPFDRVDARHGRRQVRQRLRKRRRLVQTGDLDDQLHAGADERFNDAGPGDLARALVAGIAE